MRRMNEQNVGEFQEADFGSYFTYKRTNDFWALQHGFQHEIDVLDGIRYGNVKKTVVYICADENEVGAPVINKWNIKKHLIY
jgi:hypothetical protein